MQNKNKAVYTGHEPLVRIVKRDAIPLWKSIGIRALAIVLALVCCVLGVLLCGLQGVSVTAGAVCALIVVLVIRHNLGGMSGDISGSALTIGEACAVIALALTAWL